MEVLGLTSLIENLRRLKDKAESPVVAVSFAAEGAIYVHEMMEPKTLGMNVPRPSGLGEYWGPPQYGPKFLENTARELDNSGEIARIVREGMRRKLTLTKSLVIAGLRVQRESQERVPVEYGQLRASAQTAVERT